MRKAIKILNTVSWAGLGVAYACLAVLFYLVIHSMRAVSDGGPEMTTALVLAAGLAVSVISELIEDELKGRLNDVDLT
jgi:high-affinity Fe2+/Pb2+ permease